MGIKTEQNSLFQNLTAGTGNDYPVKQSPAFKKKYIPTLAFSMEPKISFTKLKLLLPFLLILVIWKPSAPFSREIENISLKNHTQLATPVPNPMDMTKIFPGKTYQVTDPKFILQFYFDGKDIYGIIVKREKESSIFLHWCLFRSCEESSYDYKIKIATAFTPPYDQLFFSAKLPANLKYRFSGLKFYTVR